MINGNPNNFFYPINFLLNSTFAGRSIEFIIGILLAKTLEINKELDFQILKHKTAWGSIGILCTCYIIGLFQPDIYHHGNDQIIGRILSLTVLPFFTALLIAGLISEKTFLQTFLSSKIMVLLGNASFAFYLIHISYVNQRIKLFWLGPDRNFIILWVISIVLYLCFEKPIYNAIRVKFK
jgi:peptidoglycan/LPS O-acetylase OafA/YrhL